MVCSTMSLEDINNPSGSLMEQTQAKTTPKHRKTSLTVAVAKPITPRASGTSSKTTTSQKSSTIKRPHSRRLTDHDTSLTTPAKRTKSTATDTNEYICETLEMIHAEANKRLLKRHKVTKLTDIPHYASSHSDELAQMVIERGEGPLGEALRDIGNRALQAFMENNSFKAAGK